MIVRIAAPRRETKPRKPEDSLKEAPRSKTGGKEGTGEEELQGTPKRKQVCRDMNTSGECGSSQSYSPGLRLRLFPEAAPGYHTPSNRLQTPRQKHRGRKPLLRLRRPPPRDPGGTDTPGNLHVKWADFLRYEGTPPRLPPPAGGLLARISSPTRDPFGKAPEEELISPSRNRIEATSSAYFSYFLFV
jgi:hypothetical protein